ncbi:MAG TPA: hypothetical protein DD434_08175 [Bacteroidales bacterium]|nr:hypothetical protein [Bacteroidales bacterium]
MRYRILIVDDEVRIVQNLKQIMDDAFDDGIEIRTATSGPECLRIFWEWKFDLLITDIRMPGIDGIELVKGIRESNETLKIIVISAYEDFEYARTLLPFGIVDYLVKPIGVDRILHLVNKIMQDSYEVRVRPSNASDDAAEKYNIKTIISDAKLYIQQNKYISISLVDVAEDLHVSKSYLSATFKQETGENITNYINDIKLKEAKKLLLKTDSTINEISEKLGYNTPKYFIERFSKSTGITPAKYRNLLHKKI